MSQPENELRVALEGLLTKWRKRVVSSRAELEAVYNHCADDLADVLAALAPATTPTSAKPIWKNEEFQSRANAAIDDSHASKVLRAAAAFAGAAQACTAPSGRAYKGPINIPCSACSAGDSAMEYHNHDYVRPEDRRSRQASHPLQDKPPRFDELEDLVAAMGDCSREFLEGMTESERSIALTTLKAHALVLREDY